MASINVLSYDAQLGGGQGAKVGVHFDPTIPKHVSARDIFFETGVSWPVVPFGMISPPACVLKLINSSMVVSRIVQVEGCF